jgi:CheY-like chemotaxis protein
MGVPLNLLIVEDSPIDAELLVRELRRAGFEVQWQRVETKADFLARLQDAPDVIISDCAMPQFSGVQAVDLLRQPP